MNLINKLKFLSIALIVLTNIRCKDCNSTACENGNCTDGTCVCIDGYSMQNESCLPLSYRFIGSGNFTIDAIETEASGNTSTRALNLILSPDESNPRQFLMSNFRGIVKNNILFPIDPENEDLISTLNNPVSTASGLQYNVSGSKNGSWVNLIIQELNGSSFELSYYAN